jgi:hypothetical protein
MLRTTKLEGMSTTGKAPTGVDISSGPILYIYIPEKTITRRRLMMRIQGGDVTTVKLCCVLLYIDEKECRDWGMFNVPANMKKKCNSRCKSEGNCIAQIKNE